MLTSQYPRLRLTDNENVLFLVLVSGNPRSQHQQCMSLMMTDFLVAGYHPIWTKDERFLQIGKGFPGGRD